MKDINIKDKIQLFIDTKMKTLNIYLTDNTLCSILKISRYNLLKSITLEQRILIEKFNRDLKK